MSIQDYFIMGSEPLPDLSVDDIRKWLSEHTDKQSIIDAYAAVYNKAWWIDDLDNVFIDWVSNGRLTSFSKKNFKSLFDMAG